MGVPLALSSVEIGNQALAMIGVGRISSWTDSEAGRVLTDIYEAKVKDLLRKHPWNFAIKRASIQKNAAAPEWGYANSFNLPADCVRVLETSEDKYAFSETWKVESGVIVTDISSPLEILYVARVGEDKFDPAFTECLASMLARELAQPLTGNLDLQAEMQSEAERKFRLAKGADGQEGSPPVFRRATWVSSKFAYPSRGNDNSRWGS